jgi:hypothetical protein
MEGTAVKKWHKRKNTAAELVFYEDIEKGFIVNFMSPFLMFM